MHRYVDVSVRATNGRRLRLRRSSPVRCFSKNHVFAFGKNRHDGKRNARERLLRYPNGDIRLIRYPATDPDSEAEIERSSKATQSIASSFQVSVALTCFAL